MGLRSTAVGESIRGPCPQSGRKVVSVRETVIVALLVLVGMAACQSKSQSKPKFSSETYINSEQAKIKLHAKELVKSGHMTSDFIERSDLSSILGRYAWYGDDKGYFGAYSFYEPAFEQAKRGWFLHGEVLQGSNELWPQDDWSGERQAYEIKFDKSAIGYKLPPMNMSWFKDGKYTSDSFTATIIGFSEDGHIAILDKRAPHHAEQWGMSIVPADWQDMCACTNVSGQLQFVDGHPVAEPIPHQ